MLQFHEFFQLIVCVADEYDEMLLARKLGNLVSPLDIYKPCVDKHSRQSSPMTSKTSREDDPSWASPLFCHTQGGQSRAGDAGPKSTQLVLGQRK